MKHKLVLLVMSLVSSICLFLLSPMSARAAGFIRVTPSGSTTWPCGDTWTSACELQTALTHAANGDEIWVAEGTYRPTAGMDRHATFQLRTGLALYGGFAGSETTREQRNWVSHPTLLSGDLGAPGYTYDNTYHVPGQAGRPQIHRPWMGSPFQMATPIFIRMPPFRINTAAGWSTVTAARPSPTSPSATMGHS